MNNDFYNNWNKENRNDLLNGHNDAYHHDSMKYTINDKDINENDLNIYVSYSNNREHKINSNTNIKIDKKRKEGDKS